MTSDDTLETTWEDKEAYWKEFYYKEEIPEDQEDFEWKKQEEKFATFKYRSPLTPKVINRKLKGRPKRFKQKIR